MLGLGQPLDSAISSDTNIRPLPQRTKAGQLLYQRLDDAESAQSVTARQLFFLGCLDLVLPTGRFATERALETIELVID
jgi:hypothetical protein